MGQTALIKTLAVAMTAIVALAAPANAGKPACNDGIDNDGDGATDFPADAGCSGNGDDDETNPSPPPPPPPPPPPATYGCSDGVDNDGDLLVDYPADVSCSSPQDYEGMARPTVGFGCSHPYLFPLGRCTPLPVWIEPSPGAWAMSQLP